MQIFNLTVGAAATLSDTLRQITLADHKRMVLERIELKCGDASGSPDGWNEVEVTPIFGTTTISGETS